MGGYKFVDVSVDPEGCIVDGVVTLRCIPCLFQNLVNFGLILAAVVAVFFIVISGIRFIGSGGDPEKVAKARRTMTFAIAGLVIIVLSYSLLNFAGAAFGITFFTQCK